MVLVKQRACFSPLDTPTKRWIYKSDANGEVKLNSKAHKIGGDTLYIKIKNKKLLKIGYYFNKRFETYKDFNQKNYKEI